MTGWLASHRRTIAALTVLGLLIGAGAVVGRQQRESPAAPESPPVRNALELSDALQRAGFAVTWMGPIEHPALDTPGQRLQIDGTEVQVFEFDSEAERSRMAGKVDGNGNLQGAPLADWQGQPHLWATERLLVTYPGLEGGTVLLLSALLGDPMAVELSAVDEPFPPAVSAAQAWLAKQLDVAPERIDVADFAATQWPDGCLGLPAEGEECPQLPTPGWEIQLDYDGRQVEVRSDEFGTELRTP